MCDPAGATVTRTDAYAGLNYSCVLTPGATADLIYPRAGPFGRCVILPVHLQLRIIGSE